MPNESDASGLSSGSAGLPPLDRLGRDAGELIGDFELVRVLGQGAYGVVWEARQLSLQGKLVALKRLRPERMSKRARERFERELQAIARLDHPAIVPIVTTGYDGKVPYYVMKYVEGLSAAGLLRRLGGEGAPRSAHAVREALESAGAPRGAERNGRASAAPIWEQSYVRWVVQTGLVLADALQHLHERGIVHRDVKPGNVMIDRRGQPVLVDFGLVLDPEQPRLTRADGRLGSLPYSAPEQVKGEEVDSRADVYSLGATLYELLSFRLPFDASRLSELERKILHDDPFPIPAHLPANLRTIVLCALEKSPARRYATPGAMAHDLRQLLAGRPILARPRGLAMRAVLAVRRHPKATLAAAVAAAMLLVQHGMARAQASRAVDAAEGTLAEARAGVEAYERGLVEYVALFERGDIQRVRPNPSNVERTKRELAATRERLADSFRRTAEQAQRAFESVPSYGPARDLLAEQYALELRHALHRSLDVRDPTQLGRIEERLRRFGEREYAHLLDPTGSIELRCPHEGARIRLRGEGADLHGGSVLRAEALLEGVYQAVLSAPGHVTATVPVLVRRRACDDERARPPSRVLEIELLRKEEAVEGYAYVPPGWTLVEDEPPRWEHSSEGYQVRVFEVSYAEWIDFMNVMDVVHPPYGEKLATHPYAYKPRSADGVLHVIRDPKTGIWRDYDSDYAAPDRPVRGLKSSEMGAFVHFEEWLVPPPPGWVYAMPRSSELVRAARGAGAARFPWGAEWDPTRVGCYRPEEDAMVQAEPYEVGECTGDVSSFGVRDLAGSLAEYTVDSFKVAPDYNAFFGGSYREHDPDCFTTTRLEEHRDEPDDGRGFRLVLRRLAPWQREPEPGSPRLEDRFARADGSELGGQWELWCGNQETNRPDWDRSTWARLDQGTLVCKSGSGYGSTTCQVRHPVESPAGDWRLCARLSARWEASLDDDHHLRGVAIGLSSGVYHPSHLWTPVTIRTNGLVSVSSSKSGSRSASQPLAVSATGFADHCLEFVWHDRVGEVRVWPADGDRPCAPQILWEEPLPRIRAVIAFPSNRIGAELSLHEVLFEPLDGR